MFGCRDMMIRVINYNYPTTMVSHSLYKHYNFEALDKMQYDTAIVRNTYTCS